MSLPKKNDIDLAAPAATSLDALRLRRAFGHFATGVAVVTTVDANERPLGMTVNSLASLSLDPPLLLWSIAHTSRNHAAFTASRHFAVHVLHEDQAELSTRFYTRDIDRFADVPIENGHAGTPLLRDYLVRFHCDREHCMAGGDHTIVIGRITAIDEGHGKPLLYYHSRIARLATE